MYSDSEMVIWFSAGRGLSALLRPLLMFAWPILAVIAGLALLIWPWANQQTQEMKDRYGNRGDLERVSPRPVPGIGQRHPGVLPGQGHAGQQVGQEHLHLHRREGQADGHHGAHGPRGDGRAKTQFLLLSDGQRLERQLDGSKLKVSEFQDLGNKVGGAQLGPQDNAPSKTLSTWALVASPDQPEPG